MDEYDPHRVDASAGRRGGGGVEHTLRERTLGEGERSALPARALAEPSRRRGRVRRSGLADGAAGYDRRG